MNDLTLEQAQIAIAALIEAAGLTVKIEPVAERDGKWHDAAHYRFTVSTKTHFHKGFYSKGWSNFGLDSAQFRKDVSATFSHNCDYDLLLDCLHGRRKVVSGSNLESDMVKVKAKLAAKYQPNFNDILAGLISDAQGSDQEFAEWASDLGYDSDSIKAKAIWDQCNDTRRFLERAFSADSLDQAYQLANAL